MPTASPRADADTSGYRYASPHADTDTNAYRYACTFADPYTIAHAQPRSYLQTDANACC